MIQSPNDIHNEPLPSSIRPKWLQRAIGFYSRKFHFIVMPIGIIMAAIHLKFAITYLDQCPIQPMINIYMIVHASVHLLIILLALIGVVNTRCNFPRGLEEDKSIGVVILVIILVSTFVLFLFSFAWLIAGSIWVFSAKVNGVQGDVPSATNTYCQSELFRAAFVLLIVNYIIHGIIIFVVLLRYICCKRKPIHPPDMYMNNMNNKI
ncbi:hypothetical protein I4U23_016391 [Adineta vaga]|nr:hypothetical protein I4U23_016391 [Adineta vaga]